MRLMRRLAPIGVAMALAGCQNLDDDAFSRLFVPPVSDGVARGNERPSVSAVPVEAPPPAKIGFQKAVKTRPEISPVARQVGLSFDAAGLDDVVRSVFKEVLGQTLLVQPGTYPVVNFAVEGRASPVELIELLQSLCAQNKARLFFADGVYQLTHDVPDASNQRVMRLEHRLPSDFRAFGTAGAGNGEGGVRVYPDDASRQVVLSGSPAAVAAVGQAISELDRSAFDGLSFRWIAVREPRQIADALQRVAPMSASILPYGEGLLLSGVSADLGRIEKLISLLDSHADTAQFVYDVRSLDTSVCKDVAAVFAPDQSSANAGSFFGSTFLSPMAASGGFPLSNANLLGGGSVDGAQSSGVAGMPLSRPFYPSSNGAGQPNQRKLNVVTADGRCVLRGQRRDVIDAIEVLRLLDRKQPVVMFDAALFEVTLTDELRYGVRWFFDKGSTSIRVSDTSSLSDAVNKVTQGAVAVLPYKDWRVAVDALRAKTLVNVLAQPHVTVDAGQEGKLQVGDQVPVASSTSRSEETGRTVTTIQYRDVGVILRVRPVARSDGDLQLTVNVEVTGAQKTTTSGIDSPTITRRGADAVVTVADGQSLLLGGLLREEGQDGVDGVPLVGDIPVVGELFKQTTRHRQRQEMALVLTPHVVDEAEMAVRAREVLDRIRKLHLGAG